MILVLLLVNAIFYHSTPRGKRKEKERKREEREKRKRKKKKGRRRGQKEEINDSFCMWQLGRANCRLKKRIKLIPP
jgi:hypothetical protein